MSMREWAQKEIELAIKRERESSEEEWDYGAACYESALRAFESLLEDGHSGMSIGFTQAILNRLIDGRPLTPIEDTPDVWNDITRKHGEYTSYQCRRMSSLFKDVYSDGRVEYHDNDQYRCKDVDGGGTYTGGPARKVVRELFPIAMPYYPSKPLLVYTRDFLTDKKRGDFDTVGVLYAVTGDGTRTEINRFFKEGPDGFIEIDEKEYYERYDRRIAKEAE